METHNIKLKSSYIIKDSPERLFSIISSKEKILPLWKKSCDYLESVHGDYNIVGSVFEFVVGDLKGTFTIIDVIDTHFYKNITARTDLQEPYPAVYYYKYNIYWNSCEKNSVFALEIDFDDADLATKLSSFHSEDETPEMCKDIAGILMNSIYDLNQTESIIINTNIEDLWKIITDWELFRNLVPIIGDSIRLDKDTDGTTSTITVNSGNSQYVLKVISCTTSEEEYMYILETVEINAKSPKQELEFKLIYISDSETYLSFKHTFMSPTKYEGLYKIGAEKKNILQTLKQKIEA